MCVCKPAKGLNYEKEGVTQTGLQQGLVAFWVVGPEIADFKFIDLDRRLGGLKVWQFIAKTGTDWNELDSKLWMCSREV